VSAIKAALIWEAMRRDFTAISGFSMAISFVAAVVLCLQIAQMKSAPEWQIAGATVWIVQLAIFGTAVYAWRSGISFSGWILGILVLIFVSLSLTTTTALTLAFIQGTDDFSSAFNRTGSMGPRVCAAIFALMVFYPLRVLLPIRKARPVRKRFKPGETEVETQKDGDPALLLVGGDQTIPVWDARNRGGGGGGAPLTSVSSLALDGTIDLPLSAVMAQVPRELWGDAVDEYSPSHPVSIPIEVVGPQLKEARIVVRWPDLCEWLPPGAGRVDVELGHGEQEELVLLPLEFVVPQLPHEVFELPEATLPAWAEGDEDGSVLFATIPAE
jgi:hypothetical protein